MNCAMIDQRLDEYLDGALNQDETVALERHAGECLSCRTLLARESALRRSLRELPAPEPSEAFFDHILAQATTDNRGRRGWGRRIPGVGLALAASVMLVFAVGVLYRSGPAPVQDLPGLAIALNQPRDVSLVFESKHAVANTRFTIQLPDGIEVSGYPGQRELSWEGSLAQGKNLLVLPVEARSGRGGELVAAVTSTRNKKSFVLKMEVLSPQEAPIIDHADQETTPVTVI